VVGVSIREDRVDRSLPICELCGCEIDRPRKRCAALDDGRCQPWSERRPRGPFTVPRLPRPSAATRSKIWNPDPRRWSGLR